MVIAQHGHAGALAWQELHQHFLPRRIPPLGVDIEPLRRAVPFDEQPRFAQVFRQRIGRERPRGQLVQLHQRVDRRAIDLGFVLRPGIEVFAHPDFAEILDQHEALRSVLGMDLRCTHRILIEPACGADEWRRVLVGRRGVHQHRAPGRTVDAEIAAERSVTRQRIDRCAAPAGIGKEGGCTVRDGFGRVGRIGVGHGQRLSQSAPGLTMAIRA